MWNMVSVWTKRVSRSVMSDSLQPHGRRPPGSSVCVILQARILEWVAIPFSRGSSQTRDQTQVSGTAGRFFRFFTIWATRKAHSIWYQGPVWVTRRRLGAGGEGGEEPPTGRQSTCHCKFHLGRICLQAHTGACWQDSVPWRLLRWVSQLLAGHWRKLASVSCSMGLSIIRQLASLEQSREREREREVTICNLTMAGTSHDFCSSEASH